MISAVKTYIRKIKSALFRKEIDASTLEKICEAANPNLLSYLEFLKEHHSHIDLSIPTSRYIDLYKQNPSLARQEIESMIQQHGCEKILNLFRVTFYRCSKNAARLIMKHRLENNIILNENNSIIIKNLDIIGNIFLEFNQFIQVSFIRNIFRNDTSIKIKNSDDAKGIFERNQARENLKIAFYNISCITSTKNKYMANTVFSYEPLAFGLNYDATPRKPTTLDFNCNKIFSLSIADHIEEEKFDRKSMPIRYIGFTKGNNIEQLRLQTASNKMFIESLDAPSADIESIFFDTRENIGAIRNNGIPLFAFAEAFFRELKKQATAKGDLLLEKTYQRQEKIFLRTRLFNFQDKCISWWSELSSDNGTSWGKPLGWLLLFQFILALTAYYLFAGYDPYLGKMCPSSLNIMCTSDLSKMCTPYFDKALASDLKECTPYLDKGLIPFLGLFAWFMNPVSLLPPVAITMASGLIYVLFLFQKLFSAVFYYEIVKVLRRFSR